MMLIVRALCLPARTECGVEVALLFPLPRTSDRGISTYS